MIRETLDTDVALQIHNRPPVLSSHTGLGSKKAAVAVGHFTK